MISNKEKNFISVVIYVHNNENEIGNFLKKVNKQLNDNFEKYEIICVNDKSYDNSVGVIKNISKTIPWTTVSIINMSYFQGVENAMNAGLDFAIGDFVYEFDRIDIDYDLNTIIDIYKEALNGYDIVSAKANRKKFLTSRIFYKVFNNSFNSMNQINTETFRILSRRAINRVKTMTKTIPYRKAVYANCGLNITSITYDSLKNSRYIISKEIKENRKEIAIDAIILFTDVAYKFAIFMAVIMMMMLFITSIYTFYIFICSQPIAGWTTTMLLLSFAFFGIFSILTIMIKYLSIIINLIFKKQEYLIESIEKINKY